MRFSSSTSIKEATQLYNVIMQSEVIRHWVENEDLASYCLLLKNLKKELGENVKDEFWKTLLQDFSRYHYQQYIAPLPTNHVAIIPEKLLLNSLRYIKQVKMLYSQYIELAEALFKQLKHLSISNKNTLLEKICEITNPKKRYSIVIKDTRLIPIVEKFIEFKKLDNYLEVMSIEQLKRNNVYERVILLGASSWFPDFIFTAPRAKEIHVISYNWIKDKKKPLYVFANPVKNERHYWLHSNEIYKANTQENSLLDKKESLIEADEVLPTVDWHRVSRRFSNLACTDKQEIVTTKLFLLENALGVFLECDEKTSLVIDLQEDILPVLRKPVLDIKPGMFILLRTSGGGDLIVPIANRILGDKAEEVRKIQKLWKTSLNAVYEKLGSKATVSQLKQFGSIRANEVNLRNWMSYKSIKTDDYKDFLAIMGLIGKELQVKEFWQAMEFIDQAHRKAGRYIRKLLLKQVQESDLTDLEKLGQKSFELSESEGGSLTAFRVVEISNNTFETPISHLADVFDLNYYE